MAEPGLFRLIQAHLCGYKIFPLPEGVVPYMGNEAVLTNLRKEADFYGLQNLVSRIDLEIGKLSDQNLQGAHLLLTIGSGKSIKSPYIAPSEGSAYKALFEALMNTIGCQKAYPEWNERDNEGNQSVDGYKSIVS